MKDWIIKVMGDIVSRPAINPENFSGKEEERELYGEEKRADYLEDLVEEMGFEPVRYEVVDEKGFVRPSLVIDAGGKGDTVWVIAHMDTVSPEGWTIDPFKLKVEGEKLYGLGVNDNGVGLMASLIILKEISEGKIELDKHLKIGFVADEEAGSNYGLKFLLKKGIFKKEERAIVPDFGNSEGSVIEIAEKGILWLKFVTKGKQTHASTPHRGDNAFLKSIRFANELYEELHSKFAKENSLFDPPTSTFEPTKKEKNVDSVNIIPGEDVHYWDCRVLPEYNLDEVISIIRDIASKYDTTVEILYKEESSSVNSDDWIVNELKNSVKAVLDIEAKLIGIGGGTFAGILRKNGVPSVVWQVGSETAHQPNEWELITNYEKTARVISKIIKTED